MSKKKDAAVARRKFTSQNVEIMKEVRATLGHYGQKNAAAARRMFTSQNVEIMKGVRATLGNNFQKNECVCGMTHIRKPKLKKRKLCH